MKFPFQDAPNMASSVCSHVLNNGKDILFVSHDEDDGAWQFLCGNTHETSEARLVSLKYIFDSDNTIGQLCDIPYGCFAERKTKKDNWMIRTRKGDSV